MPESVVLEKLGEVVIGFERDDGAVEIGFDCLEFFEVVYSSEQTVWTLALTLLYSYLRFQHAILAVLWLLRFINKIDTSVSYSKPLLLASEYPVLHYTFPFSQVGPCIYL